MVTDWLIPYRVTSLVIAACIARVLSSSADDVSSSIFAVPPEDLFIPACSRKKILYARPYYEKIAWRSDTQRIVFGENMERPNYCLYRISDISHENFVRYIRSLLYNINLLLVHTFSLQLSIFQFQPSEFLQLKVSIHGIIFLVLRRLRLVLAVVFGVLFKWPGAHQWGLSVLVIRSSV